MQHPPKNTLSNQKGSTTTTTTLCHQRTRLQAPRTAAIEKSGRASAMAAASAAGKLLTVAIDGPAGAGKSTVSKALAKRLALTLVDTGALYRSVALEAQRKSVGWEAANEAALGRIAGSLDIRFEFDGDVNKVFLRDEDVSELIRTPEISQGSSKIAALPKVREGLMELQRSLASRPPGAVLEGRDIGTVVLPDARVKFFLTASLECVKRRRPNSDPRARYARFATCAVAAHARLRSFCWAGRASSGASKSSRPRARSQTSTS